MPRSIAIVAPSGVPFQMGGAENLWKNLYLHLSAEPGEIVELIKLPAPENDFKEIVESYKQFSHLDLSHFDVVITTKYPAWAISHPAHILYLMHTMRPLYDHYHITGLPETLGQVPHALDDLVKLIRKPDPDREDMENVFSMCQWALAQKSLSPDLFSIPGPLIRELVHFFDRVCLNPREIKAYFAISKTVTERPDYLPAEVIPKVLYHPSHLPSISLDRFEYFFTASRLNSSKRIRLLVEAMRYVTPDIPFKIAGVGPDLEALKKLAEHDRRIEFLGYVPDAELPGYYARSLCVPFVPYDEDYGLITIEAMAHGKPVITAFDSGGVCEFVIDGVTGYQVEPKAAAIGLAMQKLAENPEIAYKMGHAARQKVSDISWKSVIDGLLSAAPGGLSRVVPERQTVVVACHFAANPNGHGGERRLYHFCASLAENYNVLLICFNAPECKTLEKKWLLPTLCEIRVPWLPADLEVAEALETEAGASVFDLILMQNCPGHDELMTLLEKHARQACCLVLSHPFLYPAVKALNMRIPILYDAHNVETDLKKAILGDSLPSLQKQLLEVEKDLCQSATAVFCCSKNDGERFSELHGLDAGKCHIVPNGWHSSSVKFTNPEQRGALRKKMAYPNARLALFMGSQHKPNVEAVLSIIKMARDIKEVQFIIVGNVKNAPEIRACTKPANVHFVGLVSEDVKNMLIRAADIGLNPMLSGGGTNLKIIEYIGAGLETISTPFGIRGIDGQLSQTVHICDLEDFPEAIRNVLRRPVDPEALKEASDSITAAYDWNVVMEPVSRVISKLANIN